MALVSAPCTALVGARGLAPNELQSVTVLSGGQTSGNLAFEVPSETQWVRLRYKPLFPTSDLHEPNIEVYTLADLEARARRAGGYPATPTGSPAPSAGCSGATLAPAVGQER